MNNEIPPVGALIFTADTQWAIAAQVPTSALNVVRSQLPEFLQTKGSRVVTGDQGMSVLLVFGGSSDMGEDLATELSKKYKISVFLLDFNDEAPSIWKVDGARFKRKTGHPAEFLDPYGVIVPGYEPGLLLPPPVVSIGVVEDLTLEQARKAMPEAKDALRTNSRGVLVNDITGFITLKLSKKLKRRSFTLYYDRPDDFFCIVRSPDQQLEKCFSVGTPDANSEAIDSILGETTLDGILRVLDIPRDMLFPDGSATAGDPSPESGK